MLVQLLKDKNRLINDTPNFTSMIFWNMLLSLVFALYIKSFHCFYDALVSGPQPSSSFQSQHLLSLNAIFCFLPRTEKIRARYEGSF